MTGIRVETRRSSNETCLAAAQTIAGALRQAIEDRGRATLAVSGGKTPATMLAELLQQELPWPKIEVFQVDERCAPDGHPDRNALILRNALATGATPLAQGKHLHLMAVPDDATPGWKDVADSAARQYGSILPADGIDVMHLGLGDDGHTASLIPNDPVLGVGDRPVAVTNTYQGRHRITLTVPTIRSARLLVWLATGSAKAPMIARLLRVDPSIPAGQFAHQPGVLFTDTPVFASDPPLPNPNHKLP